MDFWCGFCLHDTHGQYLAFSKGYTCGMLRSFYATKVLLNDLLIYLLS